MSEQSATAPLRQPGRLASAGRPGRIPRRDRYAKAYVPLSYAQESIWLEEQSSPGSAAYNISSVFRVRGPLHLSALQRAFAGVVNRHEILRTTYHLIDGIPQQVIGPEIEFVLEPQELPPPGDDQQIKVWVEEQTSRGFDLSMGPLFRVSVLRLGAEEHVIVICMHHIVSDGWSQLVFLREMNVLYEGYRSGKTPLLPELAIQYADFASWQRESLKSDSIDRQLNYWRQQLSGGPLLLNLPLDHPRPSVPSRSGAVESFNIPAPVLQKLRQLSQQEGATLFIGLMAAFQTLLHQFSGQTDIVVGTPFLGRNSEQLVGLIGLFLNTLSIRVRFDATPAFREILRRTRAACVGAFANANVPFTRVVSALNPQRDASHTPIFQTWFSLDSRAIQARPSSENLEITPLFNLDGSAKFDLIFQATEEPSSVTCSFRFNTELFRADTVRLMVAAFSRLLESVVQLPDTAVADLPLADEAVTSREPDIGRDRKNEPPEILFERHAISRPNQAAVITQDRTWTYGELNAAANRLGRHLRDIGVRPESSVAVQLERSVHSLIAMLAIQKAGAAYVPIDSAEAPQRAASVVNTVRPFSLITQTSLNNSVMIPDSCHVLCLDTEFAALQHLSAENLDGCAQDDNLAYIIFTSGSTGEPKGVAVSRGSLAKHCNAISQRFQLSCSDRVLQFATLAFDVSIEQILPTLAAGATIFLRGNTQWSANDLFNVIEKNRLTVANLPTVYWQTVTAEWNQTGMRLHSGFRLMIVGGEAMSPAVSERWLGSSQPGELLNAYGPTEAVITTSFLTVTPGISERCASSVPIDEPLPDRTALVLNERLHPVPAGAPGELFLGGNLARGYFGMPAETAMRFIPDPFAENQRLYRTGDIVRLRQDGTYDFLGRRDYQVKLRGYRIELEEVESALKSLPSIRDAAVKIWNEADQQDLLVAYVTSSASQSLDMEDLRVRLKQLLPDFMVPANIVLLDSMPVTLSGKIDRHALPAPVIAAGDTTPQDPLEEEVLQLFRQILKLREIGRNDDFFEAGGHSLLAVRLAGKIRERFGVAVALPTIFRLRTGAALAAELRSLQSRESKNEKRSLNSPQGSIIPRADRGGSLPLSYAQERLWFVDQLLPGSAAYNMPVVLRVRGSLDVSALQRSFAEIVDRHEVLRTTFKDVSGVPQQVISGAQEFSLPVYEMDNESQAHDWLEQEVAKGFDLARGPLLRVNLIRFSDEDHVLVIVMHHIISDGWSLNVFVKEMIALYEAHLKDAASPLPALPLQYADYAVWQKGSLQGEVLDQQLRYWKRQLNGIPGLLRLPTDHPRPLTRSLRGDTISFAVEQGLLEELRSLSQKEEATLFMTLLAGFQTLLHYYSGENDIVIGTDDANRQRPEIEPLIGFFINQLAVRNDFSGNPRFRKILERVRQTTLDAYMNSSVPFEKVVDALGIERTAQYSPIFQVEIVMQNTPREDLNVSGLSFERFGPSLLASKFDLTLFLIENGTQLNCAFNYSTDLFDRNTIEQFASDFVALLENAAANPDATIDDLASSIPHVASRRIAQAKAGLRDVRPMPITIATKQI